MKSHALVVYSLAVLFSISVLGEVYSKQVRSITPCFLSPLAKEPCIEDTNYGYRAYRKTLTRMGRLSRVLAPLEVDPLAGFKDLAMDMDSDSEIEDPTEGGPITESDIKELTQLIQDVKQGKMGPVWREEMLAAEDLYRRRDEVIRGIPGGSDDDPKPDVNELLNEKNEELDATLKDVLDISTIEHPSEEDITKSLGTFSHEDKGLLENSAVSSPSDEEHEQYFRKLAEGKLDNSEIKKVVSQYYRQRGLLNEPVVKTVIDCFEFMWKQNSRTFDLWFPCISHDDGESDYDVHFLPQTLTISYKGSSTSIELSGKVDVSGCFWYMQNLPEKGKIIGMVLLKRPPKYMNTWEHLFSGNTHDQSESSTSDLNNK